MPRPHLHTAFAPALCDTLPGARTSEFFTSSWARLQPRGDCPRKAIDTVATKVVEDVWVRVRAEAIARMKAEPTDGSNSGEPNVFARPR